MNWSLAKQAKELIVKEEGFRSKPYQCSEGVWTFGHGLTYITEEESLQLVDNRIKSAISEMDSLLSKEEISLDEYRKVILIDMIYQLGINGVSKFKKMLDALRDMDYDRAADEMLNSRWHKQTPVRCEYLAKRMRGLL